MTPAQDIGQQLGQAFAGGTPPDVFYVDASRFADYASVGALEPYADRVSGGVDDFYPSLRETFTYQGKLYCIPKDFSTLALQINTDLWARAGLTEADYPTTWDQLTTVSQKLKAAKITPFTIGDTRDRIGAFMVAAGGWIVSPDGKQATADTPQNLQALQYVQTLLKGGLAVYPKQVDTGWGGEAFGKGKVAMAMEGNWIKGALQNDFPNVKYVVRPMPAGPSGMGTLSFTQCWGISAKSQYKEQAIKFVEAMTTADQQIAFATGVRGHAVPGLGEGCLPAAVPQRQGVHRQRGVRAGAGQRAQDGQCPRRLRQPTPGALDRRPEGDPDAPPDKRQQRASQLMCHRGPGWLRWPARTADAADVVSR